MSGVWGLLEESSRLEVLAGRPGNRSLSFRSYLRVPHADHRRALTRLLASEHPLAIQSLREGGTPRDARRCRFCRSMGVVEDEVHVLLVCTASDELATLRESLKTAMAEAVPGLTMPRTGVTFGTLHWLLSDRRLLPLWARYVYDVFALVDSVPYA